MENMRYTKDINLDNFTLTVNAVNDAPTLLQPLKGLGILEDSGVAAMVLYTIYDDVAHLIYSDEFCRYNNFTLTVNTVNDAPVLL